MSECDRFELLISEYLDGELQEPEKTELESHLRKCSRCRRVCDAFRAISLSLGEEAAPAGLTEDVMAAVRTRGGSGAKRASKPGKSWPKYLALAACLMLAVLSAVRLSQPRAPAASQPDAQPAQFGVAAVPGDLEPRDAGDDSSLTLEDATSQDSADGTDDKYNYNAESCLPLPLEEPEQVSLLRISGRAEAELTDPECIAAVFELLCCVEPTQQPDAPASYTLAYESEDGSGTLELWSLDGELLCSDGAGAAYEAAGSEAELLELIG